MPHEKILSIDQDLVEEILSVRYLLHPDYNNKLPHMKELINKIYLSVENVCLIEIKTEKDRAHKFEHIIIERYVRSVSFFGDYIIFDGVTQKYLIKTINIPKYLFSHHLKIRIDHGDKFLNMDSIVDIVPLEQYQQLLYMLEKGISK